MNSSCIGTKIYNVPAKIGKLSNDKFRKAVSNLLKKVSMK